MLALSPLFSTLGWPLEDPISHEQYYYHRQTEPYDSFLHNFPSPQTQKNLSESTVSGTITGGQTIVKKLNHNASERDRRKKINSLFSSLRSLLPSSDQTKLSIPATVSRVLKYIPELQEQVKRLTKKKEEILSKVSNQEKQFALEKPTSSNIGSSLSTVSADRFGDRELVIQISTLKVKKSKLCEVLFNLEADGFQLLNSTSFESFGDRVFYNLHLQEEGITRGVEPEVLTEKLRTIIV